MKSEIINVSENLLKKYSTKGPRYTSYPPASSFHSNLNFDDILNIWRQESYNMEDGVSIYVHIPFCRKRCLYCGCFTSSEWDPNLLVHYVNAIRKEIEIAGEITGIQISVKQIAFGGGSPNVLPSEFLLKIMEKIEEKFKLSNDCEISIELDPRILTDDYLEFLHSSGFNRLSLGIQDLDPEVGKAIGREQDEGKLKKLVEKIKSLGFHSFNFDLIYGLPLQTLDSFSKTIEKVIQSGPTRVAIFGYAHVPSMFPHQKNLEKFKIPGPQERMELFRCGASKLLSAGYERIGLDHFAREGDELLIGLRKRKLRRNFMGYTVAKGSNLIAFGASGISGVGRSYVQNHKELDKYFDMIEKEGKLAWSRGFILSDDDLIRRDLIMNLFCNFFVNLEEIERKYGIDADYYFSSEFEKLKEMENDGLLVRRGMEMELTDVGKNLVRNVCMVFDKYLEKIPEKRIHSLTV